VRLYRAGLSGPGGRRGALLLAVVVSVNASYTVLIPLVPELRDRARATPAVIALTFALFAGAKALAQPLGGRWVDRWRPGPVACVALLTAAAGIVVTALARDPLTLLAGRICWGAGEGVVTPAIYAGLTLVCGRYGLPVNRMMGSLGSASVAGFLLGPLVAGLAAPAGIEVLLLGGAVVVACAAVAVPRAVPAPGGAPAPGARSSAPPTGAPGGPPAARWWVVALTLGGLDLVTNLSYSALEPTLPLYLAPAVPGGSPRAALSTVFAAGLAVFGVVTWLTGRHTDHLRLRTLIKTGLALSALGLAGLSLSPSPLAQVVAWFVVIMIAQAVLYFAARRGIVALRGAAPVLGKTLGLFGLTSDAGNFLGPVIAVALYQGIGGGAFVALGGLNMVLLLVTAALSSRGRIPYRLAALAGASARPRGRVRAGEPRRAPGPLPGEAGPPGTLVPGRRGGEHR
jgi:MFS family permease